jgi:hypothetical protein
MCETDGVRSTTVWLVRHCMPWALSSVGFAIGLALGCLFSAAGLFLLHCFCQAALEATEDEKEREEKAWS